MAPLIHRARSVVKCRTSHPTMRIKICAITQDDDTVLPQPKTVEAFFRASLVKLPHDGTEPRQAAGRMILTQREGTPAIKNSDQNGATVSNGKLIASQVRPIFHSRSEDYRGVALNSMVDRRQLATRYAVQVEVALNIDNKLIVVLSHPFLIAITNDQTEPLLYSIFWSRLQATEQNDAAELYYESSTITWSVLRQAIANYVKSQVVHARALHYHEICHIQCMILLPRVLRCKESNELDALELALYGNTKGSSAKSRVVELRNRLLTEQILPTTLIERREFMVDKCYSSMDMSTELPHTVWAWLFRATEMLQDIGHKLCPSPNLGEKKGTKTKRQMAACEEYQTMLSLFNKGSLCVKKLLQDVAATLGNDAILIRICDENVGFLSFVFGFEEGSSDILRMGSISAEQVKDFKQGLPEMLIDEQFPAKFSYLIKIEAHSSDCYDATVSKRSIFHSYETMRLDSTVHVHDSESIRINPLTGEKVPRVSRATDSTANELGAVSYVEPREFF
ncbi:unnamed protein product [Nippostrongylus brasiliensis]|uniref:Protein kinase domain-containing protein n=1 Tax=Nippostrongylus brasiliensis TaxID=27835 RepID=A0A158QWG1_NIPBR|nr:unnamed protein product [Nippostrongylus brasiliensis]